MPKTITRKTKPIERDPSVFTHVVDPDRLYYYKEIAALLSVKESIVYDWIYRTNRFPGYVQLARGRRVLGTDLIAFLEANYVKRDS